MGELQVGQKKVSNYKKTFELASTMRLAMGFELTKMVTEKSLIIFII